jgi:hypothetical protein
MISAIPDIIKIGHDLIDKYILDKPQAEQAKSEFEMHLNDVNGARQREIEITKATGMVDKTTPTLAFILVVGFMLITFSVLLFGNTLLSSSNQESMNVIMFLFGYFANSVSSVVGYYFGSSKGRDNFIKGNNK